MKPRFFVWPFRSGHPQAFETRTHPSRRSRRHGPRYTVDFKDFEPDSSRNAVSPAVVSSSTSSIHAQRPSPTGAPRMPMC
eukprot:3291831-Pyramimonas_sp.AAC.1